MTSIEEIDAVLKCLYSIEYIRKDIAEIAFQTDVPLPQVSLILKKLEKDQLIEKNTKRTPPEKMTDYVYQITFEGKVFAEQGYYHGKINRENSSALTQTWLLWVTAIGTGLAGIYAIWAFAKDLLNCR